MRFQRICPLLFEGAPLGVRLPRVETMCNSVPSLRGDSTSLRRNLPSDHFKILLPMIKPQEGRFHFEEGRFIEGRQDLKTTIWGSRLSAQTQRTKREMGEVNKKEWRVKKV